MARRGLTVLLVPSTDPHGSEYIPDRWQRRRWASSFTGSVGDLVVTRKDAFLWTDNRYFIQAEQELAGSEITLMRMGRPDVPSLLSWLADRLGPKDVVGVDSRLVCLETHDALVETCRRKGTGLRLSAKSLIDEIWDDRPPRPESAITRHPVKHAGESTASKLGRIRAIMGERGAQALVVSKLDAIAWVLNIRGQDVPFNPLTISYALIEMRRVTFFVDLEKVSTKLARSLGHTVDVRPYGDLSKRLEKISRAGATVWVDPSSASVWIQRSIKKPGKPLRAPCPIVPLKAKKNRAERAGARSCHELDAVALVRFLRWLELTAPRGKVTELSASERLGALRAEAETFRGPSFNTISAFGGHGAIVHYGATERSNRPLGSGGLYLVDSGGQYLSGTTDVTRTVLIGDAKGATDEHKSDFTRVLKGVIALSQCRFPAGTTGQQLDALARTALWQVGLDYGHGTGHGVGSYLGVHEGPAAIAPTRGSGVPLEEGYILSNEPGVYKRGRFGIRTENLMLVSKQQGLGTKARPFYGFETLTLCPIDARLLNPRLLEPNEKKWLDTYHAQVRETIGPKLGPKDAAWLRRVTRPIAK